MPDDVGGRPSPNGWEPDDERGGADEGRWDVVFDEEFVKAAAIHEPTAVERLLAAAQARAEAESARARALRSAGDDDLYDDGRDPVGLTYEPDDIGDDASPYGRHGGALRPYRGSARWHRPVAWLLALLMGIGMVALAFSAVYRGAAANRQDQVPPASTGVDQPNPGPPAASPVAGPPVPVLTGTPATAAVPSATGRPSAADRTPPPASFAPRTP
ncbi:SCO2584 family spore wall biosynthesis protein [Streptomyces hydrogenans]|uniref:SCO2584 family spore wall biosynthesis protein n=1 Tax=Streptomyces hydrogenans TaxID=1873719 RepID=UPI00331B3EED